MVTRSKPRVTGAKATAKGAIGSKGPKSRKRDRLGTEIGERLARARAAANLTTIASLHKRTKAVDQEKRGISQPVLLGYEAGEYRPGARELRLLCLAMGVSPTWLLFGEENATKDSPVGAPVPLTFARIVELTEEQKRGALLGMLFGYMTKQERDVWINLVEMFLRTKLGDKQFELRQFALQSVTEFLTSPEGFAGEMGKILEAALSPEQLEKIGEAFKKHAAELGVAVDESRGATP